MCLLLSLFLSHAAGILEMKPGKRKEVWETSFTEWEECLRKLIRTLQPIYSPFSVLGISNRRYLINV